MGAFRLYGLSTLCVGTSVFSWSRRSSAVIRVQTTAEDGGLQPPRGPSCDQIDSRFSVPKLGWESVIVSSPFRAELRTSALNLLPDSLPFPDRESGFA